MSAAKAESDKAGRCIGAATEHASGAASTPSGGPNSRSATAKPYPPLVRLTRLLGRQAAAEFLKNPLTESEP